MPDYNLIAELLKDEETRNLLRSLLVTEKDAPAKPVYTWCAKMTTVSGVNYYHPMVTQATGMKMEMPTLEELQDPNYYTMLYSENQFEAYNKYEAMAKFAAQMSGKDIKLIAIPAEIFGTLKNKLSELIGKILGEINRCMDPIDRVSELTHGDATRTKVQLYLAVLSQMDTLWDCVSEEMELSTAEDHEYVSDANNDYSYEDDCDGNCDCCGRYDDCDSDERWDCDF